GDDTPAGVSDGGERAVKVIGVAGRLGHAVRRALFREDAAHRVVTPGFPARGVAHGRAAADTVRDGQRGGTAGGRLAVVPVGDLRRRVGIGLLVEAVEHVVKIGR